jgi:hypothetical protein
MNVGRSTIDDQAPLPACTQHAWGRQKGRNVYPGQHAEEDHRVIIQGHGTDRSSTTFVGINSLAINCMCMYLYYVTRMSMCVRRTYASLPSI